MGYATGENHGLSNHKLYKVWSNMKIRCYYTKSKSFKNYGARGITMCDEWKDSFSSFYTFCINNGWKEGLEIDRISVNENYEPNNCQFITKSKNLAIGKQRKRADNRSGYVGVSFDGDSNKWRAYLYYKSKPISIGRFFTIEEALQARIDKEIELFGEQRTNIAL